MTAASLRGGHYEPEREPASGSLSKPIVPPWASTIGLVGLAATLTVHEALAEA